MGSNGPVRNESMTHSTLPWRRFVVNAFITNKLDYCNSLLAGLAKYLIKRLQCVQNAAARLVSGRRTYDHISPVLR